VPVVVLVTFTLSLTTKGMIESSELVQVGT
jgi:hypothetical protein